MDKKYKYSLLAKYRGFTLIELMVTLAIAAILVSIAIPNFNTLIQNNRITAHANEFLSALSIARSEAIKRGATVAVTANTPGQWQMGWTIATTGAAPVTLYVNQAGLAGGTALTNPANMVTYNSRGFLAGAIPSVFNLTIPNCTGNQVRTITISPSGSARVTTAACPT